MSIQSCYVAATVKLQSIITFAYTNVIINLIAIIINTSMYYSTYGDILAGLDSRTCLVLHLVLNVTGGAYD